MQFTRITLATFALLGSTLAAPNNLNEHSAANKLAVMEERAALAGYTLFPENALTKRDCDCASAMSCNEGCGAFNNAAGQGGGFCTLGCYDQAGCGTNTLCCTDGSSCEGSGCCDA